MSKHVKPKPHSKSVVPPPPTAPEAPRSIADELAAQAVEQRPITPSLSVEDLPPRTEDQQAEDARLLEAEEARAVAGVVTIPVVIGLQARKGTHTLVNNTSHSLHVIGIPNAEGNPRAQHALSKTLRLLPGVNRLTVPEWALAMQQKMVQLQVAAGIFVELGSKSLGEAKDKEALALVDATVDVELLKDWQRSDKREVVRNAIAGQLEKIAPTKPKDDEEGDQE